jgi:His/Glu/Gln/Arg/opine family amino acid ABC transporter permease subunit
MNDTISLILNSLPFLLRGALTTLQIASIYIGIGLMGGLLLGVANCQKFRPSFLARIISAFVTVIRGTPLFVQLLIVYYALPEVLGISLSPFTAGVITLGMNSTAYISEIVRGGVNSIADGQWEAAYVLGLNRWNTLRKIIFPQTFQRTLPSLINEMTALIKETSILMVIGVAELTKVSKEIVARELDPMTLYLTAALIYLAITTTIALGAQWLQKKGTQGTL